MSVPDAQAYRQPQPMATTPQRQPFLNVALIPHDIIPGDTAANLAAVEHTLNTLTPGLDLVVLPEMFNTGFTLNPTLLADTAETDNGPTITTVKRWAAHHGFAIWGGFTQRTPAGGYANRGFMVSPDSTAQFYNKRHLFSMSGEGTLLTPGHTPSPIVNLKGWRLAMSICYDIRFPVWNRNVDLAYDALIVPANWAHARVFAWKHMLIARAVENQAYVVGCNRSGSDDYGDYPADDSFAFNHWGDDIARRTPSGIIYCTFDSERLNRDRYRFSPWRDADSFTLLPD